MKYDNKWVRQIAGLQHKDGSWGCFHTLSRPTKEQPITTEQALRRLRILGLTVEDEPIGRALEYMRNVLKGKIRTSQREKVLNWDAFEAHITATWIRFFEPDDSLALPVARMWAEIVMPAFRNGSFDEETYAAEYRKRIPKLNAGERLIKLPQFYMVNLLKGVLDKRTENHFIDHIINNPDGIYYIYSRRIADLPAKFDSKHTSYYLAALEQLAGYSCAAGKLNNAKQWLLSQRDVNGEWDMGPSVKDGVYFPLSESWRKPEDRRRDCTFRINNLLKALTR